jgi:hypothetical protein
MMTQPDELGWDFETRGVGDAGFGAGATVFRFGLGFETGFGAG